MNVWVPVRDEEAAAAALLAEGWAVSTGARFRIKSGPAIRVTIATLDAADAPALAKTLARALRPAGRSQSA
jgi:hypothetical protein